MSRTLEALWLREHEARMASLRPVDVPAGGIVERLQTRPGPSPRLSLAQVAEMRELCRSGLLQSVVAARFGINVRTLRKYLSRGRA